LKNNEKELGPHTTITMSEEFLQSMTFATAGEHLRTCDCDECDNVPVAILEAINRRKRLRLETGPIKRTQQRTFLNRYHFGGGDSNSNQDNKKTNDDIIDVKSDKGNGTISVYSMTMPMNAEPLVEFGTSHRIVWVKRLSSMTSTIQSIGEGIIGSSDEEQTRKDLVDWSEGNFFLVPTTEGKAAGWIHTNKDNIKDTTNESSSSQSETTPEKTQDNTNSDDMQDANNTIDSTTGSAYAVLFLAKIPMSLIVDSKPNDENNNNTSSGNSDWARTLINHCRDGLLAMKYQQQHRGGENKSTTTGYYKFEGEALESLKSAFCGAEKGSGIYST
jgi:hypothetical protein